MRFVLRGADPGMNRPPTLLLDCVGYASRTFRPREERSVASDMTTNDLVPVIAQILGKPVLGVRVTKDAKRLYSRVLFLEVDTGQVVLRLVAKLWAREVGFTRQMNVLRMAMDASHGDTHTTIPYLGASEAERVLLMPEVRDRRFDDLCRLSLHRPLHIQYLRHKRAWLQAACQQAGRWLRRWHASTAQVGPLAPALQAYMTGFRDELTILAREHRDQLRNLVDGLGSGKTCVPHSDFTPLNLFWKPGTLTVIDLGMSGPIQMTPCWDQVCFEIGLTQALRFSRMGLGKWVPGLDRVAVASFRDGYGDFDGGSRARLACLAIRHMVLYASDAKNGAGYRRRAAWHAQQLRRALTEAAQP